MKHLVFDLSNVYSPSTENKNVVVETKREMPKRCECSGCSKKLVLTDLECKCKKYFCSSHRFADNHKCDFDYRNDGLKNLEKNMVKIEADKLDRI
jgi:predicted nucleic acid binding AN1-type Zn finger protein